MQEMYRQTVLAKLNDKKQLSINKAFTLGLILFPSAIKPFIGACASSSRFYDH